MSRSTLVLGASPEPSRYAYLAALKLLQHGHLITLVGKRTGEVGGVPILQEIPSASRFHTVTLYLNPMVQESYHAELLALRPERIIFNPGTEHDAFAERARAKGIEVVYGCTLVMLGTGQY